MTDYEVSEGTTTESPEAVLKEYWASCNPAPYTSERALAERLSNALGVETRDWVGPDIHSPCCTACGGGGVTSDGPCWDCRGTGHSHA